MVLYVSIYYYVFVSVYVLHKEFQCLAALQQLRAEIVPAPGLFSDSTVQTY